MRKIRKYVIPILLICVVLIFTGCSTLGLSPKKPATTTNTPASVSLPERISSLEAQLNDLNVTIASLQTQINDLQSQINEFKK